MAVVLVVEDRAIDRKYLAKLLGSAGHTVIEAGDGAEALQLAAGAAPDLVISDILMPTIDGYELVRRMRCLPTLVSTPVIFYTATYNQRQARALAAECGVREVLVKPSEPKEILAAVAAALANGHQPAATPRSRARFAQDHLRVVSSALASKIDDLEASEQRMAAVVEVARQLAAERDAEGLMRTVCCAAREVTLGRWATVGLLEGENGGRRIRLLAISGLDPATKLRMAPPSPQAAAIAPVLDERRVVRLRNPSGRPEDLGLPAGHPATRCCLVLPLATPHEVHGYLAIYDKLAAAEFSADDERVATALAAHAGVAFENVRLYEHLVGHTRALEQEVAERRRAEDALRESEARTQLALAAGRMGVWDLDLATDRLMWSDTLAAAWGRTPEQAPTTTEEFLAMVHPDDREAIAEGFRNVLRDGTLLVNELRTDAPDGRTRWVAARAEVQRDADGKPMRVIGVGMDVSEHKLLEEKLRQAAKMEAIGQLAGGVAHDFNNLLTVIRGYAELLALGLPADGRQREDVDQIMAAADRATGLTRQLLAFSRKQVVQPMLVDLNRVVAGTAAMLRRLIGEHIDLVTITASEPANVLADPGELEQILMNLAVNARDAMPGGGRLSIETSHVTYDGVYTLGPFTVKPGRYVMLAVSDNGLGMDEKTKERIFEPFFTTKERGLGTGLGLATVYGIVKQCNGSVWVYSEPGLGSTFKVYLPHAAADSGADAAAVEPAPAPTGNETILLVEDEAAVRRLARVMLESAGYRVLVATTAQEAEELLEQHGAIDLLLTDVIMPGTSGPTLHARLAAKQPGLRAMFMSGYTDDAVVAHGLPAGVLFLQKPFTAGGLRTKVREALQR